MKTAGAMATKNKTVILTYYLFPCHHPVLEHLFARELGSRHEIVWLFDGGAAASTGLKWFNTTVMLGGRVKDPTAISPALKIRMRVCKWFKFLRLIAGGGVKIVVVRDMPLAAVLVAMLGRLGGFDLYFQCSAPLGDINIAYFRANRRPATFGRYLGGRLHNLFLPAAIRLARIVFPITDHHGQALRRFSRDDKFVTLSMGVDAGWIESPRKAVPLLEQFRGRFEILTYFGTLSLARNPAFILRVFAAVKKGCPACRLLLIGQTAYRWEEDALRALCQELAIADDVIFTGALGRDSLADHLAYATLSICAIPPAGHYVNSSPTKLYESLGLGVPVVGNIEIREQEMVLEASRGGIAVEYDVQAFAAAALTLLKDKALRDDMARNGREYVIRNYTYGRMAQRIDPLF